jgi:hypothetical protein
MFPHRLRDLVAPASEAFNLPRECAIDVHGDRRFAEPAECLVEVR